MLETFPEVGEQYAKEILWIRDTFQGREPEGQSLYFDRCFSDFLGRLLVEEQPDKARLKRAFTFLEDMASSDDIEVRNLLQVTVLEYLRSWHILQRNSEKLMLPETKKLFKTVKQYLGEPSQNEVPYFETLKNEGRR
jgi:hypothetical protein